MLQSLLIALLVERKRASEIFFAMHRGHRRILSSGSVFSTSIYEFIFSIFIREQHEDLIKQIKKNLSYNSLSLEVVMMTATTVHGALMLATHRKVSVATNTMMTAVQKSSKITESNLRTTVVTEKMSMSHNRSYTARVMVVRRARWIQTKKPMYHLTPKIPSRDKRRLFALFLYDTL